MPDIKNKHNKLKQKRSQKDIRFRRFGSSLIVICLIQMEVILVTFVNERFGTAISFVKLADLGFLDVFSSSDVSVCHLT